MSRVLLLLSRTSYRAELLSARRVNKPLLDELFDRPAALRERVTMRRVLLVIRVGAFRVKVAPKRVQHGQLVHLNL